MTFLRIRMLQKRQCQVNIILSCFVIASGCFLYSLCKWVLQTPHESDIIYSVSKWMSVGKFLVIFGGVLLLFYLYKFRKYTSKTTSKINRQKQIYIKKVLFEYDKRYGC